MFNKKDQVVRKLDQVFKNLSNEVQYSTTREVKSRCYPGIQDPVYQKIIRGVFSVSRGQWREEIKKRND